MSVIFLPDIRYQEIFSMTPNEVIYYIRQNRELSETWKQLSREEKEDIIRRMETREKSDLPKTLLEVKTGQNRLF